MNLRLAFARLGPIKKEDSEPDQWPLIADKIESTIEVEKKIYNEAYKKITASGMSSHGVEPEKRIKKFPEYNLSREFESIFNKNPDADISMKSNLVELQDLYQNIAEKRRDFEQHLDMDVMENFKDIFENITPKALKNRKNLAKACSELKVAKDRLKQTEQDVKKSAIQLQAANSQVQLGNSFSAITNTAQMVTTTAMSLNNNNTSTSLTNSTYNFGSNSNLSMYAAKMSSHIFSDLDPAVKSAMEIANPEVVGKYIASINQVEEYEREVAHLKDVCLTDFFTYKSQANQRAALFLKIFNLYSSYYKECLDVVNKKIPDLTQQVNQTRSAIYGVELEEHLKMEKGPHSYVLKRISEIFNEYQFYRESGIFRVAGQKSKVDLFSSAINVREDTNSIVENCGPYAVADALKQYLREMPTPLLTHTLYQEWYSAEPTVGAYKKILDKMPKAYYENLKVLIELLANVAQYQDLNKMTPSNLAIVFGPNLLRIPEQKDAQMFVTKSSSGSKVIQVMIENAGELFGYAPKPCLVRDHRAKRTSKPENIYQEPSESVAQSKTPSLHPPAPIMPVTIKSPSAPPPGEENDLPPIANLSTTIPCEPIQKMTPDSPSNSIVSDEDQ